MGMTITEKADTLGTFRFVFVRLMETLARWVPTSPELEVKTLLGRHIWTLAQHADAIGHRTVELRAKLHYERPPVSSYADAIQHVGTSSSSGDRVGGFYDAVLPDLAGRLERYLEQTDELLDAPTVEIVRRILADVDRMQDDRRHFRDERPDVVPDTEWVARIKTRLASCEEFVDRREAVTR